MTARIDESRPFIPVRIAVLTISDTRTPKTDKSGPLLVSMIKAAGHEVAEHTVAPDDEKEIRKQVKKWIKDKTVDVVITTGGTGFTGRDVTPEAVRPLYDKEIDGFSALFHMLSYQNGRHLDRAVQSLRRARQRHAHLLRAGLARRVRGRVERHPQVPARQSPPPLFVHRADAAPHREQEEEGEGELALARLLRCTC